VGGTLRFAHPTLLLYVVTPRITNEHPLVYRIQDDVILIAQCRYHY